MSSSCTPRAVDHVRHVNLQLGHEPSMEPKTVASLLQEHKQSSKLKAPNQDAVRLARPLPRPTPHYTPLFVSHIYFFSVPLTSLYLFSSGFSFTLHFFPSVSPTNTTLVTPLPPTNTHTLIRLMRVWPL